MKLEKNLNLDTKVELFLYRIHQVLFREMSINSTHFIYALIYSNPSPPHSPDISSIYFDSALGISSRTTVAVEKLFNEEDLYFSWNSFNTYGNRSKLNCSFQMNN